jgi:hypothetical protein
MIREDATSSSCEGSRRCESPAVRGRRLTCVALALAGSLETFESISVRSFQANSTVVAGQTALAKVCLPKPSELVVLPGLMRADSRYASGPTCSSRVPRLSRAKVYTSQTGFQLCSLLRVEERRVRRHRVAGRVFFDLRSPALSTGHARAQRQESVSLAVTAPQTSVFVAQEH